VEVARATACARVGRETERAASQSEREKFRASRQDNTRRAYRRQASPPSRALPYLNQCYTKFTESKKREDFRSFLEGILADQPRDQEIHVILDNYCTHKRNEDWLAQFEGRIQFHFTPTSASWLNQIEIVFSLLQRKTLRGASFKSKDELRKAIEAFIQKHNEGAKPFRWRKREVKGSQLRNTLINLCN